MKRGRGLVLATLALYLMALFGLHVYLGRGEPPWRPIPMLASLAFFGFAAGHAILLRGVTHASVFFMIASGVSLTFEMIGLRTGLIYGDYYYTDRLGLKLFDLVPVFVPLGWFMMAYAAHDLATLITGRGILCKGRPEYPLLWILWPSLVAAGAMTAWDLVMEPQMVATKHWVWVEGGDYFGIPVRNFIGWLVTMLIVYVSYRSYAWLSPPEPARRYRPTFAHLPSLAYALTGLSNIIGNVQIGQPAAALVGVFAMGGFVLAAMTAASRNPH